jgi:PadR family transcriptional regulator PadR
MHVWKIELACMSESVDKVIERWIPQFKKGLLEFIILLKLQDGPAYGYELAVEIKKLSSFELAEGTLYPLLNRLKRDGLVDSEWQAVGTGNPRKYYKITTCGIAALSKMKMYWTHTHGSILKMVMPS